MQLSSGWAVWQNISLATGSLPFSFTLLMGYMQVVLKNSTPDSSDQHDHFSGILPHCCNFIDGWMDVVMHISQWGLHGQIA